MMNKTVRWVCGLVFVAAFSFPAFADQSIGYRQYYNEGVKAFKKHDDQKALRCFVIARIYGPNDKYLNKYLSILDQRGVVLELHPSQLPPDQTIGYKYYFSGGIEAFYKRNDRKAIRYFKIALIFNPESKESERYLRILYQRQGLIFSPSGSSAPTQAAETSVPAETSVSPGSSLAGSPSLPVPAVMPAETTIPEQQPTGQPVAPKPQFYVPLQKAKQPPAVISMAQIFSNSQLKPRLQIELNSSVILEGKDIQRFLIVQEGFINAEIIDADHIKIDALRIGTTFLHIWDDSGRHTLYVEVVFPKSSGSASFQDQNGVIHSMPFVVNYSNDWDTYYSGKNIPGLQRKNYEFSQSLGTTGETPYGFFDASGSYSDFNAISKFDSYTVGLSQIPLPGTTDLNLRAFDAERYLSPLTLPGTTMRGEFVDVVLLQDLIGVSLSNGQEQVPLGFLSEGATQFNNSYIAAFKLTLFPKSIDDQYSFNYAHGYGTDREPYLSNNVYSLQEQHRFNEHLLFQSEQASDSDHDSELATLKWQQGAFRSGLNFRNIDKDYSTASTLPAYQGETGLAWTTDTDFEKVREDTFIEAYQDHLYGNPDHPDRFNYDGNGQIRVNYTPDLWSDSNFNFVNTPGELSPNSSVFLDQRLSRSFGIWNSLRGTVFGGAGYQESHATGSDISNYNREDVIAGIQLPLTHHLSAYTNYEYDWLDQPATGGASNPSIINAGLSYQKELNSKFSFTSQIDFHDELGVKPDSFLSGEESIIITSGFNYSVARDMNIFADVNASKVLSHIGNDPYDDFEAHVGVRIVFGGATYWDPLGTVSGIVFKDRNGNGRFGPGDEGIAGVKVKVGDKIAVTDKDGRYRIQVRAKGVDVTPIEDTVPGGLLFSSPQVLHIGIFQGRVTHADFALTSQTGIYGIVFVDTNGSGVPNENDRFINKVRVILDNKTIQKSDSHGSFYFRNVSPGEHNISIDINSLALNMVPSIKLKNEIDVAEGTNYMFNVPVQIKQAQGEQE